MYAQPPDAAVAVPARRGFTQGPLLAICCLGIILFLIAATIVLALIPLYIPQKVATASSTNPYTFTFSPNSAGRKRQTINTFNGTDGTLDSTATTRFTQAISIHFGFSSSAFQSTSNGVVSSVSGTRLIYIAGRFQRGICGVCTVSTATISSLSVSFTYNGVTYSISFTVTVLANTNLVPVTVASTNTTTTTATTTASL